jgi:hypothetical protein
MSRHEPVFASSFQNSGPGCRLIFQVPFNKTTGRLIPATVAGNGAIVGLGQVLFSGGTEATEEIAIRQTHK